MTWGEEEESPQGSCDYFVGGHAVVSRDTLRGICDYCTSPYYKLLLARLVLWKYVTLWWGGDLKELAERTWEKKDVRFLKRLPQDELDRAFDYVATRAAERSLEYENRNRFCRLPRHVAYELCVGGCFRADILLFMVSCLQMARKGVFTFRLNQQRLSRRFDIPNASFSKSIKSLTERGLLLPLYDAERRYEKDKKLGKLYTFNCNRLWNKVYLPDLNFDWNKDSICRQVKTPDLRGKTVEEMKEELKTLLSQETM